jgi:hypothetical protein
VASFVLLAFAGFAAFATSLVLLATSSGVAGTTLAVLLLLVPTLGGLWCALKARAKTRRVASALDAAWQSAVRDILESSGRELTAGELAGLLDVKQPQAEALLAALNVDDQVASRVTEDGDVAYRARVPTRLRVEPHTADANGFDDPTRQTTNRMRG